MCRKVKGAHTLCPDRCFDLTSDGVVNAQDKLCMNRALNGMAIP